MEPLAAAAERALRADAPGFKRDVLPALQATMRALLLQSWGVRGGVQAVLTGVVATELRRACDAAAAAGGDRGGTVWAPALKPLPVGK